MAQTCPHCGKEIARQHSSYSSRILEAALEAIGGADAFGKGLGEQLEEATPHQKVMLNNQITRLAESVDKADATRQFREDLTASEERGALMEFALELFKTDMSFRTQLLNAVNNRKLLPEVIETETA